MLRLQVENVTNYGKGAVLLAVRHDQLWHALISNVIEVVRGRKYIRCPNPTIFILLFCFYYHQLLPQSLLDTHETLALCLIPVPPTRLNAPHDLQPPVHTLQP